MWEKMIGKPFFNSVTMWGAVLLGSVRAAEAAGLVSPGTSVLTDGIAGQATQTLDALGEAFNASGAFLTVLGLRIAAKRG